MPCHPVIFLNHYLDSRGNKKIKNPPGSICHACPMPHAHSSSSNLPKHWPQDILYLTTLHIPAPLSPTVLETPATSTQLLLPIVTTPPPNPSPLVRIGAITNPSHPAYPEYGLFATRALPPSTFILFYLGTLHDTASTDPQSNYDLCLDRELDLSIEARTRGNEARFINDYRGIRAEGPNAEFRDCLVDVVDLAGGKKQKRRERRIGVFVLSPGSKAGGKRAKGIAKGEEIVVSYGKGFWHSRKEEEVDEAGLCGGRRSDAGSRVPEGQETRQ